MRLDAAAASAVTVGTVGTWVGTRATRGLTV
jgi:hypothetical protein